MHGSMPSSSSFVLETFAFPIASPASTGPHGPVHHFPLLHHHLLLFPWWVHLMSKTISLMIPESRVPLLSVVCEHQIHWTLCMVHTHCVHRFNIWYMFLACSVPYKPVLSLGIWHVALELASIHAICYLYVSPVTKADWHSSTTLAVWVERHSVLHVSS